MTAGAMFGISMYGFRPEHIVPVARHAEALGFSGVWVGDHFAEPMLFESVHPYDEGKDAPPVVTGARTMYDIWTMVGAIIGATSRLRVTTGVYLLPLRHPVYSARAAISAQQAAGGRFRLGLGSGWWKEESECVGAPFEQRGARMDEALRLLRPLFAGEALENAGPAFPFPKLRLTEEPVHVPLVFGGTKGKPLARAAELGDGYYGPMVSPEEAIAIKNEIERRRRELGRSNPFEFEARVRGEPTLEGLRPYLDAGFDTIVIPNETIQAGHGFAMTLEQKFRRLDEIARALKIQP